MERMSTLSQALYIFLKDVHQSHALRLTPCKLVNQLVLVDLGYQLPMALHQS